MRGGKAGRREVSVEEVSIGTQDNGSHNNQLCSCLFKWDEKAMSETNWQHNVRILVRRLWRSQVVTRHFSRPHRLVLMDPTYMLKTYGGSSHRLLWRRKTSCQGDIPANLGSVFFSTTDEKIYVNPQED